jgi:outer membrane protein TolC
MKPFLFLSFSAAATLAFPVAGATRTLSPTFLSSLRSEAAASHPAAAAAGLRAEAMTRDVAAVRLWDDPMIGLSVMSAQREMRRDDGDIQLMAEQAIPRPGLFKATRLKSDAMRRAESESAASTALEVGAAAVKNAIELALADESIEIQTQQIEWLKTMAGNARERALTPGVSGIESLKVDIELARETQILEAAKRTRAGLVRRLNLSLGRPLETQWPKLDLPASPSPVPLGVAETARISHANPKVRAMQETARAADAEISITQSERKPGVAVGVETNLYSGGDYRSTMIGVRMSLPWFNEPSYTARTDAARLRKDAASHEIEALRREIAAEVINRSTEAANAAAQARAYAGEIQTRSLETTRAIEAAWISSTATLNELLEANRMLFSVRLEQHRFIALQLAALEDLHALVPNRP